MNKMRHSLFLVFFGVFPALILLAPSAAEAQYHEYTSGKPSVEVDMSVLGAPSPRDRLMDYSTHTTAPVAAPVLQAPLDAPGKLFAPARTKRILKPAGPPPTAQGSLTLDEEAAEFPPPIVKNRSPAQKTEQVMEPVRKPERKIITRASTPEFSAMIENTTLEDDEAEPPFEDISAKPTAVELAEAPANDDAASSLPASPPSLPVPALSDLTLGFEGNSTDLSPMLREKLDALAGQLSGSIDARLQVRAFATGEDGTKGSARRIALARALSVRSYLMDKGVKPARVDVRALGTETDRAPLDRVDLIFIAP